MTVVLKKLGLHQTETLSCLFPGNWTHNAQIELAFRCNFDTSLIANFFDS